ncbi:uncharacterized protein ACA1_157970 [Acanthamoeba castellanii str. Neff]|uniref:HAM1-like N-terminal domain-containing protein n=1 Tax=Acanthamoeba castellanii (strain ATCC 30010 / Neff) TaxID=1257118 RepID=L8H976_ACACF|nr:uncharacterized protein ACA1_157970 [Acanthamoeba castellanii str. Neff]ELR22054.1 hypothetical protein ACA1_157970 [Acanthamoeba castellanii str. Neff]
MSNYPTTNTTTSTTYAPAGVYTDAYSNPTVMPTTGVMMGQPAVITTTGAPPVVMAGTGLLASPTAYTPGTTVYTPGTTAYAPGMGMGMGMGVPTNNKVVDKLPSNVQIEHTLERVREQVNIAKHETEGLNPLGERILTDTERLVDSATQFMREKNEGGKLQRLAQEGLLARRDLSLQAREARDSWDVVDGFDSDRLRSLARETLQTARMAGLEVVRSRKFRAQIRSLINLLSEAVSGERISSSDSDASDVGERYDESDRSYDYGQRHRKAPEAFPHATSYAAQAPAQAYPTGSAGEFEIPVGEGHHRHEGSAASSSSVSGLGKRLEEGLSIGGRRVRLSQEQTSQLAERFTELLRDITRRPATAELLRRVLDIFRLFDEEIDREQRGQVTGGLRSMADSEHLKRTLALAQEIFETFTGDRTLDPLIGHWRAITLTFRRDDEARRYFHSLRHFFAGLLDHPERLSERQTLEEMKEHIRWAQQLHDEKLREHLTGSFHEARAILRNVERDPATLRLKNDAKALLADIMLDDQGNVVLKTQALEQLRLIILQSLIERVRIPVPAITVNNPDMQLRLSNVVVTLRDLVPESVVMTHSGRLALDLGHLKQGIDTSFGGEEVVFEVKNVNIFIEDADIWFRRNKFPKVEDEGKIRISVGGSGVDLKLIVRTFSHSDKVLEVDRVICSVHNMKLHLYETRHDALYNAITKVLSGKIRHNIERSVENNIADYMERLNRVLTKQIAVARTKGAHLGPIASLKNRITPTGETRVFTNDTTTRHPIA